MRLRIVAVLVTMLGLGGVVAVAAHESSVPHLHYTGTVTQADGSPVPQYGVANLTAADYARLAPPGCAQGGGGGSVSPPNRYQVSVQIKDTPECIAAMQTFQPDLASFPIPVAKPGWFFRRQ
jgi:hypothetical protein